MSNRELITDRIESIEKEIKAIDKKIIKESEPFKDGKIYPATLDKIQKLTVERGKLAQTQIELWVILGQWKSD